MPNLMQAPGKSSNAELCTIAQPVPGPPPNNTGVLPPKALLLTAELKASRLPVQNRGITCCLCSLANTRSAFICQQTPS